MYPPLLSTKLYIPPRRAGFLSRPRLVERLNRGLESTLILISAPPGYGKTTLVAEWIRLYDLDAAWVSLDEGDNDFVRYTRYLIAALQTLHPSIGKATRAMLELPQPRTVDSVLTPLINEIASVFTSNPVLLVLDDYHLIQNQAVHDATAFLLEHLPPHARMVIATRADPPLPVARLRGRGQVAELRLNDLRFTTDEASRYLEKNLETKLSPQEVIALTMRTEGWAAGLQMAAISLQGRDDAEEFLQAFTGSHRLILDYLVEEVLQRQPEAIQRFLTHTAILARLSGPLCDAVTGQSQSQSILEHLDHANLFTIPQDDQRGWYRYHRLFSDLLQVKLFQQVDAEGIHELHRRASAWFEQNNFLPEAINHSIAANDFERAAVLVEREAESLLKRGEVTTYIDWVEQIPKAQLDSHPMLSIYQAWALLWSGASVDLIQSWQGNLGDDHPLAYKTLPMQAFLELLQGQVSLAVDRANEALELIPPEETFLRGMAILGLSSAALTVNDTATGVEILDKAVHLGQQSGNVLLSVSMLCSLAVLYHKQGFLHKAWDSFQQALDIAVDEQRRRLPIAGRAINGLAQVALEWNDLERAEALLSEGKVLEHGLSTGENANRHMTLARLNQAQGNLGAAQEHLNRARYLAQQFVLTDIDDLTVEMAQTRLWIAEGNLAPCEAWAKQRGLLGIDPVAELETSDFVNSHLRKYEYPMLARLRLAQGQPAASLILLDPLLPKVQAMRRMNLVIETQVLRALAFEASGQTEAAVSTLVHALTLAEPEGYVRIFIGEGEAIRLLLGKIQPDSQKMRIYIQKLLAPTGLQPPSPPPLYTDLSKRELEVLRFLVHTSLTTEEIAAELYVTAHTIRSHIKSIYSKLDVHSRLEAIERTAELGLL